MTELDQLKKAFLSDELDEETRADNERKIAEWEQGLLDNEAFASWQDSDITKQVVRQLKESYKDFGFLLATNRELTDVQRASLWAKQDAAVWLLSLVDPDAKGIVDAIQSEIRTALAAA